MADERQAAFLRFTKTIDETIELFDRLMAFEAKKQEAIGANKVALLEQCMTEEQPYLMKLRGADQKREKAQKELGGENMTFRQLIENCEPQEQKELEERFSILSLKTEQLKAAVEASKKYIELNIHELDTLLARLEGNAPSYDKNGEKIPAEATSRFKATKV